MPTCDPQWIHEYERVVSPIHDQWIVHATESSEPTCGSHLNIRSHPQLEAISLARRYGFESTLVVPAPSVGVTPQLGVLVLGSHIEGFFESDGLMAVKVMARSLAMELHDWRLSQNRRDFIMRARLTGADLELLRHVRRGLGSKQIAHELRTSSNAIDLRLSRLSSRLGVPSRSAAATLAATYGLIY
jgi:DNA-binding CsgD family transcriptional regulator